MSIANFKYKQETSDDILEFKWTDESLDMECVFQLEKLVPNDEDKTIGVSYNLLGHTKNFEAKIFEPQLQEFVLAIMAEEDMIDEAPNAL